MASKVPQAPAVAPAEQTEVVRFASDYPRLVVFYAGDFLVQFADGVLELAADHPAVAVLRGCPDVREVE